MKDKRAYHVKDLIDNALAAHKRQKEAEEREEKESAANALATFHEGLERLLEVPIKPWKMEFELGNLTIIPLYSGGAGLIATKKCRNCKAVIKSGSLGSLKDVGALLAGDKWPQHSCKKPKSQEQSAGEEVLNLFYRILDILGVPAG